MIPVIDIDRISKALRIIHIVLNFGMYKVSREHVEGVTL